jgi:hypothetical protein
MNLVRNGQSGVFWVGLFASLANPMIITNAASTLLYSQCREIGLDLSRHYYDVNFFS